MSDHSDKESLLKDILAEGSTASQADAWLSNALLMAQRRRTQRRVHIVFAAVAIIAMSGFFGRKLLYIRPVSTAPLNPEFTLVASKSLLKGSVVATTPFPSTRIVKSSTNAILVHTRQNGYRPVDDSELLALVLPRPAILVRAANGSETLVFVDLSSDKPTLAN